MFFAQLWTRIELPPKCHTQNEEEKQTTVSTNLTSSYYREFKYTTLFTFFFFCFCVSVMDLKIGVCCCRLSTTTNMPQHVVRMTHQNQKYKELLFVCIWSIFTWPRLFFINIRVGFDTDTEGRKKKKKNSLDWQTTALRWYALSGKIIFILPMLWTYSWFYTQSWTYLSPIHSHLQPPALMAERWRGLCLYHSKVVIRQGSVVHWSDQ